MNDISHGTSRLRGFQVSGPYLFELRTQLSKLVQASFHLPRHIRPFSRKFPRAHVPYMDEYVDSHMLCVVAKSRSFVGSLTPSPPSGAEHGPVLVGVDRPTRQSTPYDGLSKGQMKKVFNLACSRRAQGRSNGVIVLAVGLAVAKELRVIVKPHHHHALEKRSIGKVTRAYWQSLRQHGSTQVMRVFIHRGW
jgi:hypothetical protein